MKSPSEIVSNCTRKEKLSLLTGKSIWDLASIPPRLLSSSSHSPSTITLSDGPHGVRKPLSDLALQESYPSTCFPAGCALACSWDEQGILQRVGSALADECEHYGISVLLGPGMNLKRHPAGGRNFEYFSEDPYLTGKLAGAYVRGVQQSSSSRTNNIGACIKHFALNNQESHRFVVNVVVDERTLRELYLKSFQIAIQESQPEMIMAAYNQVNGFHCCNHKHLLQSILREEWKFRGVCVTDWAATYDRPKSIAAGLDLEMPGSGGLHNREIEKAISEGRLTEEQLDVCVERIVDLIQRHSPKVSANEQQEPHIGKNSDTAQIFDGKNKGALFDRNHQLAHDLAMECAVLLKNENCLLPLSKNTKVALIGDFAKDNPRYQGMGSSHVCATRVVPAYDAMSNYTDTVLFAKGYDANEDDDTVIDIDMISQATNVAAKADVAILFLGLPEILESEGFDRPHIHMPRQHIEVLNAVCGVNSKVIIVLTNGGAIEFPDSVLQAQAILEGYLLGQAGGSALVDLLLGKASPCGRLPETMPIQGQDIPANNYFPGTRNTVEYREGLNVGYRYFDSADVPVRFPFGHGLTYTTFEYSKLKVDIEKDEKINKRVVISFELENTGKFEAKEVVQCYVHPIQPSVYRPVHELKAFSKILLHPGKSHVVTFELEESAFSFYDIGAFEWIVEIASSFEIRIGASSRDIRMKKRIKFEWGSESSQIARESYPSSASNLKKEVNDDLFAKRFKREYKDTLDRIRRQKKEAIERNGLLHRDSLLKEVASISRIGRIAYWIIFRVACKGVKPGPSKKRELRMIQKNVDNLPLRSLAMFSRGALTFEFLDSLILAMNGQLLESLLRSVYAIKCMVVDLCCNMFQK